MDRPLTRLSLLFLAFWITGGQWLMLQSVAWVNMVRDYSQNATLSQAFTKTFDGNHPCPLCRFIQKEKAAQNAPKAVPSPQKNPFLAVPFAMLVVMFIFQPRLNFFHTLSSELHFPPFSPPPETFPQF
jgi:hypothetical protein